MKKCSIMQAMLLLASIVIIVLLGVNLFMMKTTSSLDALFENAINASAAIEDKSDFTDQEIQRIVNAYERLTPYVDTCCMALANYGAIFPQNIDSHGLIGAFCWLSTPSFELDLRDHRSFDEYVLMSAIQYDFCFSHKIYVSQCWYTIPPETLAKYVKLRNYLLRAIYDYVDTTNVRRDVSSVFYQQFVSDTEPYKDLPSPPDYSPRYRFIQKIKKHTHFSDK